MTLLTTPHVSAAIHYKNLGPGHGVRGVDVDGVLATLGFDALARPADAGVADDSALEIENEVARLDHGGRAHCDKAKSGKFHRRLAAQSLPELVVV